MPTSEKFFTCRKRRRLNNVTLKFHKLKRHLPIVTKLKSLSEARNIFMSHAAKFCTR